jgi:RNA polymerase sigma-70 factor (ECF subfamily)
VVADDEALIAEQRKVSRLVRAFRAGDREAAGRLFSRYAPDVERYAHAMLRDRHEAEDVRQMVFERMLRGLGRYEQRDGVPFRAWLFEIARNEVSRELGRRARRSVPTDPTRVNELRDGPATQAWSVLGWLGDGELAYLAAELPRHYQHVLALRHLAHLSWKEVAVVLDMTVKAAQDTQRRALAQLHLRVTELNVASAGVGRRASQPMQVQVRKLPVLRSRRFALSSSQHLSAPQRNFWGRAGFRPRRGFL